MIIWWRLDSFNRHWIHWRVRIVAPTKQTETDRKERRRKEEEQIIRCQVSGVTCQVSHVACCFHMSPVMSLTPTATSTVPPSANYPFFIHSRLVQKDLQTRKNVKTQKNHWNSKTSLAICSSTRSRSPPGSRVVLPCVVIALVKSAHTIYIANVTNLWAVWKCYCEGKMSFTKRIWLNIQPFV